MWTKQMKRGAGATALAGTLILGSAPATGGSAPRALSPGVGLTEPVLAVAGRCPTFRWRAGPADETVIALAIWELPDEPGGEPDALPVLEVHLPAGATSWTPSLDRCLEGDRTVAWSVRTLGMGGETRWGEPLIFRVPEVPDRHELEEALRVVDEYRRAGTGDRGFTERRGAGRGSQPDRSGQAAKSQPPRQRPEPVRATPRPGTAKAETRITSPTTGPAFSIASDGTVTATSFVGDGSQITGVTAADLACTDCVGDAEASSALQRRVFGFCNPGSAIRQINSDGTVVCQNDETAVFAETLTASVTNGGVDLDGTTTSAPTMCFLTGVEMQDIDNSDELATCQLVPFGNGWQLQASVSPDNRDGDVWCEAVCFKSF